MQYFIEGGSEYSQEEIKLLGLEQILTLAGFTDEEIEEEHEQYEIWRESGDFVLWRQNDFWCDSEGYIIAS